MVIHCTIDTERMVLDPLAVRDAVEMVSVLTDASLYEFTGGEAPTLDMLESRYGQQIAGSGDPSEKWLNWIMRTTDDGAAVGFAQATVTTRAADVAWLVGVNAQGRGLATEAAAAMVWWLTDHGVERIEAHIHRQHTASQLVAAGIGLVDTRELDDDGEEIWASSPT